ncbi:hypothetical protein AB4851_20690 [Burkholderia sp. 22PA0099]|uniref:hypothetical protein n=1 Tax=Burkholderia sp. 22PA0099 TaxID=3237372 RepID=UPI0039C0A831
MKPTRFRTTRTSKPTQMQFKQRTRGIIQSSNQRERDARAYERFISCLMQQAATSPGGPPLI